MAHYRRNHLDLSTRTQIVAEMLQPIPERKWGQVTEWARTYQVSRTLLYDLRERATEALTESLLPRQPGPRPESSALVLDSAFIQQAVVILSVLKGSIRDIRRGLSLLFGVERSVGYISETLSRAGAQADAQNRAITVPLPILGEADEIFQGRKPCLTVVDGRSFLVVNLTPTASRDSTTWGVTYLELAQRMHFQDLACDGGTGLQAGLREAELSIPLRPDLFHILQGSQRLTRQLEKAAYQAIATADRARRADQEERGILRRRGRRLKSQIPLAQAEAEETQAIAIFDNWSWLIHEIRQALEPVTPDGRRVQATQARATIQTAIELLKTLAHPEILAFASDFQDKLPQLLAPLEWLEQQLQPVLASLDADNAAFLLWAWLYRDSLHLDSATDIPVALRPIARVVWEILALFHRSSSLAESLHSWLRPYLTVHRGMPKWLLPLLQFSWNHHEFERGKRAGDNPLHLAGVDDVPTLAEALTQLLRPPETIQTP